MPTPGGVPVVMTSPGSSVMKLLKWAMICDGEKIRSAVLPVCNATPRAVQYEADEHRQLETMHTIARTIRHQRNTRVRLAFAADAGLFADRLEILALALKNWTTGLLGASEEIERFDSPIEALDWARTRFS